MNWFMKKIDSHQSISERERELMALAISKAESRFIKQIYYVGAANIIIQIQLLYI